MVGPPKVSREGTEEPRHREERSWLVHDDLPHGEENLGLEGLCEEVGPIVQGVDEGHTDFEFLNHVADEEVTTLDVLSFVTELGVVGERARAPMLSVANEQGPFA